MQKLKPLPVRSIAVTKQNDRVQQADSQSNCQDIQVSANQWDPDSQLHGQLYLGHHAYLFSGEVLLAFKFLLQCRAKITFLLATLNLSTPLSNFIQLCINNLGNPVTGHTGFSGIAPGVPFIHVSQHRSQKPHQFQIGNSNAFIFHFVILWLQHKMKTLLIKFSSLSSSPSKPDQFNLVQNLAMLRARNWTR